MYNKKYPSPYEIFVKENIGEIGEYNIPTDKDDVDTVLRKWWSEMNKYDRVKYVYKSQRIIQYDIDTLNKKRDDNIDKIMELETKKSEFQKNAYK